MTVSTCASHTEKDCLVTSTLQSTTENDEWLESHVAAGFRVWQIMFLCFACLLTIVIFLCCCFRFRIPRTKQEIEADYVRKKLTKKFQKHLRVIQDSEMDDMDLKRALDRVRAEIKSDTDSLVHSDATLSSGCCNCPSPVSPPSEILQAPHHGGHGSLQVPKKVTAYHKTSDVITDVCLEELPMQGGLGSKFSSVVETSLTKLRPKKPAV